MYHTGDIIYISNIGPILCGALCIGYLKNWYDVLVILKILIGTSIFILYGLYHFGYLKFYIIFAIRIVSWYLKPCSELQCYGSVIPCKLLCFLKEGVYLVFLFLFFSFPAFGLTLLHVHLRSYSVFCSVALQMY